MYTVSYEIIIKYNACKDVGRKISEGEVTEKTRPKNSTTTLSVPCMKIQGRHSLPCPLGKCL